ncbi:MULTISPECIES: LysR family transcriptional regulator [Asticcacaulis]|uniref:LysR family transcriptional regulator n=1 Tax=Asticcacaulis TaxID=76890 RepID=UPI001AE6C259|nr:MULTISPECIES: LysR family transcriptional regulator [Asticcacaulis]MBP2161325.1 DNA-binding transcriptional LysR family regulator [Asticcacaulis solisilvae]MDR6802309.1 DNA-binding transcriptional LysR family regulator [Asticcacaulis sp. BE141]
MDRTLLQFLAVADAGSISNAAERLHVTQPTLTFNLKKLESALGVSLFDRTSRGMRLTAYGQTLYQHALVMKRLHENALESIQRQKNNFENGISVGSGYTAWATFLRGLVFDYRTQHPHVPINVSLGNVLRLMDQLLAGDILVFVGHKVADLDPDLGTDFEAIGRQQDGFFVRRGHPLLEGLRTQSDLKAYPSTIAFPWESHQKRLSSLVFADGTAGKAFTSNSLQACLDYVNGTDAVLQHGELMAQEFERHGVYKIRLAPGEAPDPVRMGVYYLRERSSDPRVIALVDEIKRRAVPVYTA